MKKYLILASLLAVSACTNNISDNPDTTVPDTPSGIPTEGLVFYLPFDGNTNEQVKNLTAEESNVQLTSNKDGTADKAYHFTGDSDSYLQYAFNLNTDSIQELTITAWAKSTAETTDIESSARQLISHDDGGFDRSIGTDYRADSVGWSSFSGPNCEVLGAVKVEKDKWTFLALSQKLNEDNTYNITLQVDDQKLNAENCNFGSGYEYLWIGGNPAYGENFIGDIDEVRIYERVLSDAEISIIKSN